jgi:hypothetical protein
VSTKPTIRIIKKENRDRVTDAPDPSQPAPANADSDRTMAKTVTGWVREFKQRSDTEAGKLLASVFEKSPRPNEA